jgi:CheY-like chemotaxis protein
VKMRAFEPFFSTKPVERGRGMGLAIVYGLISQMGGTVTLHDAPDGGTMVVMRLRRASEDMPLDRELHAQASPFAVLLVEDDSAVRASSAKLLRRMGYTVTAAEHGLAALEALDAMPASSRPDVVISDVMMPVMGGVELLRAIRAREWALPVLLVSGYSTESLHSIAASDPLTAVLAKPWSATDLRRAIAAWVPNRATTAPVARS